jgi:hypothetical protein
VTILYTCAALLAGFISGAAIFMNNALPAVSSHIIILRKLLIVNNLVGLAEG